MSAREFVDTNLVIYSLDETAGAKPEMAAQLMGRLWSTGTGCVSIQVSQEFYVATTAKLGFPGQEAESYVAHLSKWRLHSPSRSDVLDAIQLHRERMVSFWDAMIVSSAARMDCGILWTEDLDHGEVMAGVEIKNPFAG